MNKWWRLTIIHFIMEAIGLGIFMISAGFFSIILFHPHFQLLIPIQSPLLRQIIIGLCMGSTAFLIITNPWLSRSGAHINPAVTISFLYLKRISLIEAVGYIIFQFIGATLGLYFLGLWMGPYLSDPSIRFIVTVPGPQGPTLALFLEFLIAFNLMIIILTLGRRQETLRLTPYVVGLLVSLYAAFESPFSGFGMNPARTFASAFLSGIWTNYSLYVFCPILGMLSASILFDHKNFPSHFGMGKPKHNLEARVLKEVD